MLTVQQLVKHSSVQLVERAISFALLMVQVLVDVSTSMVTYIVVQNMLVVNLVIWQHIRTADLVLVAESVATKLMLLVVYLLHQFQSVWANQ